MAKDVREDRPTERYDDGGRWLWLPIDRALGRWTKRPVLTTPDVSKLAPCPGGQGGGDQC